MGRWSAAAAIGWAAHDKPLWVGYGVRSHRTCEHSSVVGSFLHLYWGLRRSCEGEELDKGLISVAKVICAELQMRVISSR